MALKRITAPTVEPVSLLEAKAFLSVETDDDNVLITSFIVSAREQAEEITRRALITQTWELVLDRLPLSIIIPLPCLQSVTSIKYIDENGTEQTLSSSLYQVDIDSEPGRIVPAYGCTWPGTRNQINAVRVRYVCGYGLAVAVPQKIKEFIIANVTAKYDGRGSDVATVCEGLLDSFRVLRWE